MYFVRPGTFSGKFLINNNFIMLQKDAFRPKFKSAILAIFHFWQNGIFEHFREIQRIFLAKSNFISNSVQFQFNFSYFSDLFSTLYFFSFIAVTFWISSIFFFYFFQFGNFKDIYELGYNHATTYLAGMRKLK